MRYAPPSQAIARLLGMIGRAQSDRTIAAAVEGNVVVFPHQIEPTLALLEGSRRILLADEVGLGKTIQAGIAIAEVLRRRPAARVLALVPSSLVDQWLRELTTRFRLTCRLADRAGLDAAALAGPPDDNAWRRRGLWIASIDFIKQPHVLASLPDAPWDLVVVDEAHTVCGGSDRHAACDHIARGARHVMLLTATPHDGDPVRFSRLLGLGAWPGGGTIDDLEIFRRTRRDVGLGGARRVRWRHVSPTDDERRADTALGDYQRAVLRAAGPERRDAALLLLSVLRKRSWSTMAALAVSLRRRLAWLDSSSHADATELPRQIALAFEDDMVSEDESAGFCADVGLDGRKERAWLRRVLALAEIAQPCDSRIARLIRLVRRIREPLVIFTEFRDSLEALLRRPELAACSASLHGGQTPAERRDALARFESGGARILVATDVASLGLNLQARARSVINLDLPWNPLRLEQRAGRVDRIGQQRAVHVILLRSALEAPLVERLAERVLVARRVVGDDALALAGLEAPALREAVLLGRGIELPRATPDASIAWTVSRRRVRPARRAAQDVLRRRALGRRWQAPATAEGGPRWTRRRRRSGELRADDGALAVFQVALVDGTGAAVETHIVGVRVQAFDTRPAGRAAIVEAARGAAADAVRSRVRRLIIRRRRTVATCIACEHALGEHLAAPFRAGETQPGLFDQRARRSAADRREHADRIAADTAERVADLERAAIIDIAAPTLVFLVVA